MVGAAAGFAREGQSSMLWDQIQTNRSVNHGTAQNLPRVMTEHRRRLTGGVALWLGILVLATGCRLVQTAMNAPETTVRAVAPGKKPKHGVDPIEIQQTL